VDNETEFCSFHLGALFKSKGLDDTVSPQELTYLPSQPWTVIEAARQQKNRSLSPKPQQQHSSPWIKLIQSFALWEFMLWKHKLRIIRSLWLADSQNNDVPSLYV